MFNRKDILFLYKIQTTTNYVSAMIRMAVDISVKVVVMVRVIVSLIVWRGNFIKFRAALRVLLLLRVITVAVCIMVRYTLKCSFND